MSIEKRYVTPQEMHDKSYELGAKVLDSGWRPNFMIALWRGGAGPGLFIHELFKYRKINQNAAGIDNGVDHIAIRTSRYEGVDQAKQSVEVHNLGYLTERLNQDSCVLIVDDVFDTGLTIAAVLDKLRERLGPRMPTDIRIATLFFKPTRNKTDIIPNFYIEETTEWIVFPHELEGLTLDEIKKFHGPEVASLLQRELY